MARKRIGLKCRHVECKSGFILVHFEAAATGARARRRVAHNEEVARPGIRLLVEGRVEVRVLPTGKGEQLLTNSFVHQILRLLGEVLH